MEQPRQNVGVVTGKNPVSNKKRFRRGSVLLIVIIIAAIAIGLFLHQRHKNQAIVTAGSGNINADDSLINEHKNSSDLTDRRTLISAYYEKGDYNDALTVAQQVASQTKAYQDYMTILNICGLHSVPNQTACLNSVVAQLKPLMNNISFTAAYGAGGILEKNGDKTDAAVFYQRAYNVYDATAGGYNLMTKSQLKSHIDELQS